MVLKAFFGTLWRAKVAWFGRRKLNVLCPLALSMHSLPARSVGFWRHVL